MTPAYYLQLVLHLACEWLVSFAAAYWISQCWTEQPPPLLVRWARHRERLWIAFAFLAVPPLLSVMLQGLLVQLYGNEHWSIVRLPVTFLLSAIYGVFLGIASSYAVAPGTEDQPFLAGRAGAVSGGLIFVALAMNAFLLQLRWGSLRWVYGLVEFLVWAGILAAVRSAVGGKVPVAEPPAVPAARGNLTVAVILGFVPSILVFAAFAIAAQNKMNSIDVHPWLWGLSIVSVACCFFASKTLFSRKTGGAIAGGIVLLLLNGFIAFFFGCCATIIR